MLLQYDGPTYCKECRHYTIMAWSVQYLSEKNAQLFLLGQAMSEIWVVEVRPKRDDLRRSDACISASIAPRKLIYSLFERYLKALS